MIHYWIMRLSESGEWEPISLPRVALIPAGCGCVRRRGDLRRPGCAVREGRNRGGAREPCG